MKKLILASTSPRRKDLLTITGLDFNVQPSNYEEDMSLDLKPHDLAKFLSRGKAEDVAKRHNNAVILGADTFIVSNGKIFGKPHTTDVAKKTLQHLSGNQHEIITGFTIIDTTDGKEISKTVETKVFFKNLTEEEIDSYLATGEMLDKAGAYSIQERGSLFVEKIEGDYFNIVGLPISSIIDTLKEFDIRVL